MSVQMRHRVYAATAAVVLLFSPAAGASESVFALEEVSTCEVVQQVPALAQGHQAICTKEPSPGVRAYPAPKSDKPVYGSAQFGSLWEEKNPALLYHFVADESGGTGAGYDRLYVDLNGDKDLTNDAPASLRKDSPTELLLRYTSIEKVVFFEDVGIPLPFGSDGLRPLQFTPRLLLLKAGGAMFSLIPAKSRRGRIEIDRREYDVILGQDHPVCGWLDHPETALCLMAPSTPGAKTSPASPSLLMSMPCVGETYYRFAASPTGDKLIVRSYEGPLGDFEIGGGHKFQTTELTVVGTLRSRDAMIAVRGPTCRLPPGDYLFSSMKISHGPLEFAIQQNVHTDGGFRSRLHDVQTYPIRIRPGERFVLDFSNQPRVVFADPPRDHRVKRGETMFIEAVLADSMLDFVVSNFSYTPPAPADGSAQQKKSPSARARDAILHPHVVISRSSGEVVNEGVMHYG